MVRTRGALRRRAIDLAVGARRIGWALERGERSLDQLGLRHGADKCSAGHGFAALYEPYLHARRHDPLTVLEIGVYRGASLRMWRDYFPRARIVGIDIDPAAAASAGERIAVFIGDQSDPSLLTEVTSAIDPPTLIVDDGGHRAELQLGSLTHLWPHLEPGGLYIIEDTHTSYLPGYGPGWRAPGSTIEHLKDLVDDLQHPWHHHPPVLEELEYVHFYPATCILKKRAPLTGGATIRQRVAVAAAHRSTAWTG